MARLVARIQVWITESPLDPETVEGLLEDWRIVKDDVSFTGVRPYFLYSPFKCINFLLLFLITVFTVLISSAIYRGAGDTADPYF